MTAYTSTGRPQFIRTVTSEEVAKTATITLDLSTDGDFQALTHVFLGVQMFDAGGNLIDDSAGGAPDAAGVDAVKPPHRRSLSLGAGEEGEGDRSPNQRRK